MDSERISVKNENVTYTFNVPLPSTIEEAANLYGEERALSIIREKVKNMFSNAARILMRKGYDEEVVRGKMTNWAPFSNLRLIRKKILQTKTQEALLEVETQLELEIEQVKE